ncbi:DNA-processing protein DprA [Brachybacterium sp. UMB0905]|uniref:DNA-processing protein DprA n=1 Tax=Brachybacterium sp. UMB0905 TaxID=2069310 RepID=UPI000C802CCF|nr:DNA-processing protein DprA [Brachybacterium sp. UMB0905]PMC75061.1 DNA-protecting protein DprA [Brachybacterium sp. UMB0905]
MTSSAIDTHSSRTAAAAERTARLTWSLIAEPSDPVAHLARSVLGPAVALEAAREATDHELLEALGGTLPSDAADPSPGSHRSRAAKALARWRARLKVVDLPRALADAERRGIRVITPADEEWPMMLGDLEHTAPHCLWLHGPGLLDELITPRSIALVGSRASTPYGEDTAGSLAAAFAAHGGTVVSGGAYGIDAAAHRGALDASDGATIAVLAGGLDRLYPRGNTTLLERIRERHLLVSEAPPGTAPTRWRFLARNRLIAALSQATVVVEASWRSGALSTARHADDLSRPVGAVPGPVTSPASAGCHRIIRERGAVLITEGQDVQDLLPGGPAAGEGAFARQDALDLLTPADRRVLDAVPPRSALSPERIAQEIGFSPVEVQAALARLDLMGHVERSGGRVRRARARS